MEAFVHHLLDICCTVLVRCCGFFCYSFAAMVNNALNVGHVLSGLANFRHFSKSVGSNPVARMLSYICLMSTLSESSSPPSAVKSFLSDSCLYRDLIEDGGNHCAFMRFSFSVKLAVSTIPYIFHRCASRLLAVTVAHLVRGSLRCEIYWSHTLLIIYFFNKV